MCQTRMPLWPHCLYKKINAQPTGVQNTAYRLHSFTKPQRIHPLALAHFSCIKMSLAAANLANALPPGTPLDSPLDTSLTLWARLEDARGREDSEKLTIALEMFSYMCGKAKPELKPKDLVTKLKDAASRLGLSRDLKEDFTEVYRHKENGAEEEYYARRDLSCLLREAAARFLRWAHCLDKIEKELETAIQAIVKTLKKAPRPQIQVACGTGTRDQIDKSMETGNTKCPVEYVWNQNYNALCAYARRTGEANPPYNHKETVTVEHGKTKELELGVWCYRLRGRRAQLSQEQREKLEKIGVRLDELVVCEPSEEKRKHLGPLQSNPLIRKRVCVRRDAMVRWGDTQRRKYGNIKVKNCATGTRYLAKIMKNKVVYRKTFADRDAAEHWLTEVGEGRLVPVVVRSPMPMYFTPNEEEEESSEEEEESSEAGPKRRKYGHCEEKKTAKGTQYRAKIIGDKVGYRKTFDDKDAAAHERKSAFRLCNQ